MVFVAIAGDTRPRMRMMARERVEETILDFEELFAGVNAQEHMGHLNFAGRAKFGFVELQIGQSYIMQKPIKASSLFNSVLYIAIP